MLSENERSAVPVVLNAIVPKLHGTLDTDELHTSKELADEIERKCILIADSGCEEWTGPLSYQGYGNILVGFRVKENAPSKGRLIRKVHRVWWELHNGPVPAPLVLDHLCRNRRCRNLTHLEAVTQLVNVHRGALFTKTHCVNGHEYTSETLYIRPDRDGRSGRGCRICRASQGRRAVAKAQEIQR